MKTFNEMVLVLAMVAGLGMTGSVVAQSPVPAAAPKVETTAKTEVVKTESAPAPSSGTTTTTSWNIDSTTMMIGGALLFALVLIVVAAAGNREGSTTTVVR